MISAVSASPISNCQKEYRLQIIFGQIEQLLTAMPRIYKALAQSVKLLKVAPLPWHPYLDSDVPELCTVRPLGGYGYRCSNHTQWTELKPWTQGFGNCEPLMQDLHCSRPAVCCKRCQPLAAQSAPGHCPIEPEEKQRPRKMPSWPARGASQ